GSSAEKNSDEESVFLYRKLIQLCAQAVEGAQGQAGQRGAANFSWGVATFSSGAASGTWSRASLTVGLGSLTKSRQSLTGSRQSLTESRQSLTGSRQSLTGQLRSGHESGEHLVCFFPRSLKAPPVVTAMPNC